MKCFHDNLLSDIAMGKLVESQFMVLERVHGDIHLLDMAGDGLVIVEADSDRYDGELAAQVEDLHQGQIIKASVRSESIVDMDSDTGAVPPEPKPGEDMFEYIERLTPEEMESVVNRGDNIWEFVTIEVQSH